MTYEEFQALNSNKFVFKNTATFITGLAFKIASVGCQAVDSDKGGVLLGGVSAFVQDVTTFLGMADQNMYAQGIDILT